MLVSRWMLASRAGRGSRSERRLCAPDDRCRCGLAASLGLPELSLVGQPGHGSRRVWVVDASRAGVHAVAQQPSETTVDLGDPVDRGGERLAHGDAGTLGRPACLASACAEAGCCAYLG